MRTMWLGLVVGVFAAAVALRPQLTAVAPLLPAISHDLGLTHWQAGLLTTLPVLCTGLVAPITAVVARRWGTRTTMATMLWSIAIAGIARSMARDPWIFIALTAPYGLAAGVAGTLLPVVTRERFPARSELGTGVYSLGINLGAAVAAATSIGLAGWSRDWRGALAVLAGIGCFLALVWHMAWPKQDPETAFYLATRQPLGGTWSDGRVWLAAIVFGLQAAVFYGLVAWIPSYYKEVGWSGSTAALLAGELTLAPVAGVLVVTILGRRVQSRRLPIASAAGFLFIALAGFIEIPSAGIVWAALSGAMLGCLFPLSLVLIVDLAILGHDAASVSGTVLGFGYVVAAGAPILLGLIRDWSGSLVPAISTLGMVTAVLVVVATRLSPRPA